MRILASLALAALCCVGAADNKDVPNIPQQELQAAIAAKSAVVIDVNGTESWTKGHIPGAIDYQAVKGDLAKHLPADKNTLIVAYCGNEKCTAYKKAAEEAQQLGYTNVKHFNPGIKGWKDSGAKVEAVQK